MLEHKVIVLHTGTNWLGHKNEWSFYLQKVKGDLSEEDYSREITKLSPPLANGSEKKFKATFEEIIHYIRAKNPQAKVLISAIIPRPWDHSRRNQVRILYNNILKSLADGRQILFIETYRPFFDGNGNLKCTLSSWDGLHLSSSGSMVLKTFLCDKIDRAIKNLLV